MSLADIDKRGLVLRTAIAPPVWRGAPGLPGSFAMCGTRCVFTAHGT